MKDVQKIKNVIEALLIVSEEGLSKQELAGVIGEVEMKDMDEALRLLKEEYSQEARSFTISELAGKCRIVTKPEYMPWISNLYKPEIERLSGPSLETLAIIAYKQPITRAEIEGVRGVNVGGVLNTLLEKELIKIKGRKDVVGKPFVYGTTEKFMELFGLNTLDELPLLKDFTEEDLEFGKPDEGSIIEIEDEGEIKEEIARNAEDAGGAAESGEKETSGQGAGTAEDEEKGEGPVSGSSDQ
jgi:segregation and condensation protein B